MENTKSKFNIKRFFQVLLLVICLISGTLIFSSCSSETNYIVGIEKTATTDTSTIFTVTYSNGTTSNFTIQNGEDGDDITIDSIFEYCVSKGYYSEGEFAEFLKDYLSLEVDTEDDLTAASYKAIKSIVSVYSFFPRITTRGYTFYSSPTSLNVSSGAGVVYLMEGTYSYIITCYHVVYSASTVTSNGIASEIYLFQYGDNVDCCDEDAFSYYFSDYTTAQVTTSGISASYVGGSVNYDLAVLRVETASLAYWTQAVEIASGYDLGDTVIAVGNPESEGISVTEGMINVLSEYISIKQDNGTTYTYRVLRTDAAVNGGNSGGGLFNAKGEFVGIVNAKIEDSTVDNMAYALPMDNVIKVVNNILDNYNDNDENTNGVTIVITGLSTSEANSRAILSGSTFTIAADCVISEIASNATEYTFAYSLSTELNAGDKITKVTINETEYAITRDYMFSEALLTARVGDSIVITYTRGTDTDKTTTSYTLTSADFDTCE